MSSGSLIILALVAVTCLVIITFYNKLKTKRNQIENAKSSLDALFIKRSDLIPNLVTVVKQYTQYEQTLLNEIVQKRNSVNERSYEQDSDTIKAIKGLVVQVENYPELKANTQFTNLQYSWNEAEEQIAAGRRFLSSSITDFNDALSAFPGNVIGAAFGFKMQQWQFASESERQRIDATALF